MYMKNLSMINVKEYVHENCLTLKKYYIIYIKSVCL